MASPQSSSGAATLAEDPVVAICRQAGVDVDPGVHQCAQLAAGAHRQRYENDRAEGLAVTRSTFLWALARSDATVSSALKRYGVPIGALADTLGIRGRPRPYVDPFELGPDLVRALRSYTAAVAG